MNIRSIKRGSRLYWSDPDGGLCSCWVVVASKSGEIVTCKQKGGGEVEALASELSELKPAQIGT